MQVKAEDIIYIKGHAFRNCIDFIPGNITQQVDMLSLSEHDCIYVSIVSAVLQLL